MPLIPTCVQMGRLGPEFNSWKSVSKCVQESPEITKGDFGVLQLLTERRCVAPVYDLTERGCVALVYEPVCICVCSSYVHCLELKDKEGSVCVWGGGGTG